ncbi:uracil-DNA glycosylase [Halocatena marina]|uniref:Type-4 uracil-DNA glycosylase n=1 Tax=Halocatena marina TaxID=2934937 RepID=A0ABD5YM08_9EURY|nr:uracil-DNA glycosylase [Halocatena marina]
MERVDGIDVTACERCSDLCESRSQIVNGTGVEDASLLFIGEAPGAREDEQGEPFVGRSGDVLSTTLRDCGLVRSDVRIANCVRCRPPENRDPTTAELTNCREHLEREIESVDPDFIVTLGKVPSQHLLERDVAVTKEAGSVVEHRITGTPRRIVICLHPAATLYDRSQKETFEQTISEAVSLAGAGAESGQSRLSEY